MKYILVTSIDHECDIMTERAYIALIETMNNEDFQTHIALTIDKDTVRLMNKPIITENYLKEVNV